RAAVGIEGHAGIVAPAAASANLRATASLDDILGAHHTFGHAGRASRVVNGRIRARAGNTEAEGNVTDFIHGNRAHPAIVGIAGRTGEGAGLIDGWPGGGFRSAELVPTLSNVSARRRNVMGNDPGLMAAEIAIGEPIHQAVAFGRKFVACSPLRNAVGISCAVTRE